MGRGGTWLIVAAVAVELVAVVAIWIAMRRAAQGSDRTQTEGTVSLGEMSRGCPRRAIDRPSARIQEGFQQQ